MQWSEEQKRVIDTRDADLLVSAAAGSGKTAVLVERIIRRILQDGVSLEELIVMTFTKAAAAEMRERIESALRKTLEENPRNSHVRMQLAILPRARIATIDSICQGLIRQYYQYLDIDPGFRVADEGELKVIRADILQEMLEDQYQKADPAFMDLADTFLEKNSDQNIPDLIGKLYDYSRSQSFPERYLDERLQECLKEAEGAYADSLWYRSFLSEVRETMTDYQDLLSTGIRLCEEEPGLEKSRDCLEECLALSERILSAAVSYHDLYEAVQNVSFQRWSSGSKKLAPDPQKVQRAKEIREHFKSYVTKELRDSLLVLEPQEFERSLAGSAGISHTLLDLTKEFSRRFEKARRDANIVDFSDMEHLALKLLYTQDGEDLRPSGVADTLARQLKEIMIDEYQDSNAVQDALLAALSAERFGRPDIFMVGDVKQSIYRFRMADPHIFLEKYNTFTDTGSRIRIELNRNFRSRPEVVDSVNAVFDRIMRKELGGVEYDEAARLSAGAAYPENSSVNASGERISACRTEILIADTTVPDGSEPAESAREGEEEENAGAEELEYRMIASRIREMTADRSPEKRFYVTERNGEIQTLRPCRYGDIAILVRAARNHTDKLEEILREYGIPASRSRTEGYFSAIEVETVLSLLACIDNPHQDIPLTAVMRSPMFGFSDDELSLIRASYRDAGKQTDPEQDALRERMLHTPDFWDAVRTAAKPGTKAEGFVGMLDEFRQISGVLPVHSLLSRIYTETGYYQYVSAMPYGDIRRKNLDMLLEKAESYSSTGLHGIFNFTRYVEALKDNRFDYGEAPGDMDQGDSVTIMTIHGSKGLEFPVVFLARTLSRSSGREKNDHILIDSEFGTGTDYVDLAENVRYPGLKKAVIAMKAQKEDIGEQLRLLYVAMTRAREKLIITGAKAGTKTQNVRDWISELADTGRILENASESGNKLPTRVIIKYNQYLKWILLAAGARTDLMDIHVTDRDELAREEIRERREESDVFRRIDAIRSGDPKASAAHSRYALELEKIFSAQYAHEAETRIKPKISVSEIKHIEMEAYREAHLREDEEIREGSYPKPGQASAGALRGTAFHRAMELLDYRDGYEENLKYLETCGLMKPEELELLDRSAVRTFLESDLGIRMAEAFREGRLHREQHFMAGIPAGELIPGQASEELQLLQGIIDAYIEEKDGTITLIDYKTDRVSGEDELAGLYRAQLELYKRALEQLTQKRVGGMILYSTFLKRQIML